MLNLRFGWALLVQLPPDRGLPRIQCGTEEAGPSWLQVLWSGTHSALRAGLAEPEGRSSFWSLKVAVTPRVEVSYSQLHYC